MVFGLDGTFMVSSSAMVDSLREGTLGVNLPSAASGTSDSGKTETLVVGVAADGGLQHKKVVHVLDLVREAGFPDVGIGIKSEQ